MLESGVCRFSAEDYFNMTNQGGRQAAKALANYESFGDNTCDYVSITFISLELMAIALIEKFICMVAIQLCAPTMNMWL